MRWWRRLVGKYRLTYGWCPSCNSDAPAKDQCPVCDGRQLHTISGVDPQMRVIAWMRFEIEGFKLR